MSSIRRRQAAKTSEFPGRLDDGDRSKSNQSINNKSKQTRLVRIGRSLGLLLFVTCFFYYQFVWRPYHEQHPSQLFSSDLVSAAQISTWGSLKSGHYFALKHTRTRSPSFGLVWYHNQIENNDVRLRHWCNQHDRLSKYGWTRHDFRSFGVQQIIDRQFDLTTSFVLLDHYSWSAKINVSQRSTSASSESNELSLVPYFALSSNDDHFVSINWRTTVDVNYLEINGRLNSVDRNFTLKMIFNKTSQKSILYQNYLTGKLNPAQLEVQQTVLHNMFTFRHPKYHNDPNKYLLIMRDRAEIQPQSGHSIPLSKANLLLQQFLVESPFELQIEYSESAYDFNSFDHDTTLAQRVDAFDRKFENVFGLQKKGYSDRHIRFGQAVLSNLIGGIGQFHGYSKVRFHLRDDRDDVTPQKRSQPIETRSYGPLSLLTAVPSRSFFPRGFLWDEGFHQLLLHHFDRNLSKTIVESWFSIMNVQGWIPREVILGPEAEARVPAEFVIQSNLNANPPTFFIALDAFLNTLDHESNISADDHQHLMALFPRLQQWYRWFNTTQTGPRIGSYRWHGRDPSANHELNAKTLTSGLDDYPRASEPSTDEMHVDLLSWMMLATKSMRRIARIVKHASLLQYEQYEQFLADSNFLDKWHWSNRHRMYCDRGLHSSEVTLVSVQQHHAKMRKQLMPPHQQCVPEFGYVSLFPFLLRLIRPDNANLGVLLQRMSDPNELWTDYGLRSLSRNSSYYARSNTDHDPPYWRGPIWINLNYLALSALQHYSLQEGPFSQQSRTLYKKLKQNLIDNLFNEYQRTGYLWEHYDDRTGKGKGSHPFTGWSALVLLIMAETFWK